MLLIRTLLWLRRTATGDRAELRLSPEEDEAWSKVAAAAEVCSPLRCSFHREGSCFVARARRAADGAHVVIVNHSLLLSDVVTGNQVLPEYRHLVIDEAHHLEDEATAQLSRGTPSARSPGAWTLLAGPGTAGAGGLLAEAAVRAGPACNRGREEEGGVPSDARPWPRAGRQGQERSRRLFAMLGTFVRGSRPRRRWAGHRAGDARRTGAAALVGGGRPLGRGRPRSAGASANPGRADRGTGRPAEARRRPGHAAGRADGAGRRLGGDRLHFSRIIAEADPGTIAWLTIGQSDELGVNSAPLDVGPTIRDQLIEPLAAAILTSATLTSEGSFRYVKDRLDLHDADELTVGSPFNYAPRR